MPPGVLAVVITLWVLNSRPGEAQHTRSGLRPGAPVLTTASILLAQIRDALLAVVPGNKAAAVMVVPGLEAEDVV